MLCTRYNIQVLTKQFFDQNTVQVAKDLLGKVIMRKYKVKATEIWLQVMIIETEAYLMEEKASHASLGYTEKRKALFMPPGTIYMYYSRGKDSLNISTGKPGDAVLVKAGIPYHNKLLKNLKLSSYNDNSPAYEQMIKIMQKLNPINDRKRVPEKLCSGQTLLAKSLNLKVEEWNQKQFDPNSFYIKDINYSPSDIIETTRLGIPTGRDEDLKYRFIDKKYAQFCTKNSIRYT